MIGETVSIADEVQRWLATDIESNVVWTACSGGCGEKNPSPKPVMCGKCLESLGEREQLRERKSAAYDSVPASYRWADPSAPDAKKLLGARCKLDVKLAGESLNAPRIVFLGPAGTGKTSLAVYMMLRRAATGTRALYVPAHRLALARLQHRAGDGEPRLVEQAMAVDLLLLDDVGTERPNQTNAVPDVIIERHAEGRATWITTGLDDAALARHYGDNVARRVREGAVVIGERGKL